MKKKSPQRREGPQRPAKENGQKAAPAKKSKRRTKTRADGGHAEASRTPRYRMQVIHRELAERYDHPNPAAPPINCTTLAKKLETTSYTIGRDIEFMRNMEKVSLTDDLRSGKDRTFLLSRVETVKSTGKQFTPKKKLDLKKLKKNLRIFSTGNEETVRLHCDAAIRQLIVERKWHESQEITELPDGGVELKLSRNDAVGHRPNMSVVCPQGNIVGCPKIRIRSPFGALN